MGGQLSSVNGRRLRYVESGGIRSNPASHYVEGWALGLVAAAGHESQISEDWLLAILYVHNAIVQSVLRNLAVSAVEVIDRLRRRGVTTPDFYPLQVAPTDTD